MAKHAGDLGNILANYNGVADVDIFIPSGTSLFGDKAMSIFGRSIGESNKHIFSNQKVALWSSSGTHVNCSCKMMISPPEGAKSTWQDLSN